MLFFANKQEEGVPMLASQYCQNFMKKSLKKLHQRRRESLTNLVISLMSHGKLSITSLGRHLPGQAKVKSKIKMVWHFLSKSSISKDLPSIYQQVSNLFLESLAELRIAVDWSGCCSNENFLLRASLLVQGRSIPIYNEIHPQALQESSKVHESFLKQIKLLLPPNKRVVIVTDGGFKTPWFKAVENLGWFYVGRVRGRIFFRLDTDEQWHPVSALHESARLNKSIYLGTGELSKTSKTRTRCHFITYKNKSKGRRFKATKGKKVYPDQQKHYRLLNREPWIIVTNLPLETGTNKTSYEEKHLANYVVNIYKKRMQIEQNFRDDKNARWGFGWRHGSSKNLQTLSVIILIATIATIILWLTGLYAEKKKWHLRYQANSVKNKRVLSFLTLAKQIFMQEPQLITRSFLNRAIKFFCAFHDAILLQEKQYMA